MPDLDLSMPEFKVPGVPGYTPPFGTKKSDGEPLTTEEVIKNMELLGAGDVQTVNIDKEATSATYNIPNLMSDVVFFKPSFHSSGLGSLTLKIGKAREGVRMLIDVHSIANLNLRINLASPMVDKTFSVFGLNSWLITYVGGTFVVQPADALDNNGRLKMYAERLATQVAVAGCTLGKNLGDLFDAKDFGDFLSAIHKFSQDKDHNIQIGDYYDIPSMTLEGNTISGQNSNHRLRIVVSGYNLFNRFNSLGFSAQFLWTFQNVVFQKLMRQDGGNTGYADSYLHSFLTTTFYQALFTASNNSPWFFQTKRLLSTKNNFTTQNCVVFLPCEQEIFGRQIYGDDHLNTNPGIQFPIYRNSKYFRVKSYNGTYSSWWTSSPRVDTNEYFSSVDTNGNPDYTASNTITVGVSPAFCTY